MKKTFLNYDELKEIISSYGVSIIEGDNERGTSFVMFDENEKRYKIYIYKDHAGNPLVLLHEFHHILRGDLIHMSKQKDENFDPFIWNVAADAIINYQINLREVNGNKVVVLYESPIELTKWDKPIFATSTKELYDFLRQHLPNMIICVVGGQSTEDDNNQDNEQQNNNKKSKVFVFDELKPIKDPSSLEKAIEETTRINSEVWLDGKIQAGWHKPNQVKIEKVKPKEIPRDLQELLQAIDSIGYGNVYSYTNYINNRRDNSVPYITVPRPTLKVMVFFDVSGSVYGYDYLFKLFLSYAEFMKGDMEVETYYWSTEVDKDVEKVAGGGTEFGPCVPIMKAKNATTDVFIIFSDFEIFDANKLDLSDFGRKTILVTVKEYKGSLKRFNEVTKLNTNKIVIIKN